MSRLTAEGRRGVSGTWGCALIFFDSPRLYSKPVRVWGVAKSFGVWQGGGYENDDEGVDGGGEGEWVELEVGVGDGVESAVWGGWGWSEEAEAGGLCGVSAF